MELNKSVYLIVAGRLVRMIEDPSLIFTYLRYLVLVLFLRENQDMFNTKAMSCQSIGLKSMEFLCHLLLKFTILTKIQLIPL